MSDRRPVSEQNNELIQCSLPGFSAAYQPRIGIDYYFYIKELMDKFGLSKTTVYRLLLKDVYGAADVKMDFGRGWRRLFRRSVIDTFLLGDHGVAPYW